MERAFRRVHRGHAAWSIPSDDLQRLAVGLLTVASTRSSEESAKKCGASNKRSTLASVWKEDSGSTRVRVTERATPVGCLRRAVIVLPPVEKCIESKESLRNWREFAKEFETERQVRETCWR